MKDQNKGSMAVWFGAFGLFLLTVLGTIQGLQAAVLSDGEKEDLIFMREEEKLARDVYRALYDTWLIPVFSNIAESEQTHMDAIKVLLDRYGIQDPAADKAAGEFTNEELQDLYDELVLEGSTSLNDAMEVGVTIEEKDIADLNAAISRASHRDLIRVYTNLVNASYNHLKAFNLQLTH